MAELTTYREAVSEGLAREMRRDPSVVCLGEDIGAALQLGTDDHPPWNGRGCPVVLEQEGLGDLAGIAVLIRAVLLAGF